VGRKNWAIMDYYNVSYKTALPQNIFVESEIVLTIVVFCTVAPHERFGCMTAMGLEMGLDGGVLV
jgi:hypothetical protein